jgi:hypothetical protein
MNENEMPGQLHKTNRSHERMPIPAKSKEQSLNSKQNLPHPLSVPKRTVTCDPRIQTHTNNTHPNQTVNNLHKIKTIQEQEEEEEQPTERGRRGIHDKKTEKITEVIRKKSERESLRGFCCDECQRYYEAIQKQGIVTTDSEAERISGGVGGRGAGGAGNPYSVHLGRGREAHGMGEMLKQCSRHRAR